MSSRILHLSYSKTSVDGGIATAVSNLVKVQVQSRYDPTWIAADEFRYPTFYQTLRSRLIHSNPSLVHIHGLWRAPTRLAKHFLSLGIPYIISPHGMLDPWAMRNSWWKKAPVWYLWEKKILSSAACIHALCGSEAESIRALLPHVPISIIPNGVHLESAAFSCSKSKKPWSHFLADDSKVLLFLGRYHTKKGIHQLVNAWSSVSSVAQSTNWHLVFIGYGDNGDLAKAVLHLKNHQTISNIHVLGPCFGADQISAFAGANAFILPSFSEGLPMAAVEAMSFSTPCLLSDACNMQEAFERSAALLANPDHRSLTKSLMDLFALTPSCLQSLGRKGREFVEEKYSWPIVSSDINSMYEWVAGHSRRPHFVL